MLNHRILCFVKKTQKELYIGDFTNFLKLTLNMLTSFYCHWKPRRVFLRHCECLYVYRSIESVFKKLANVNK